MKNYCTYSISKVLSPNDAGETGGHQAGFLVPKDPDILGFFPELGKDEKNPRVHLLFEDDSGEAWKFAFIYYNNKFFGGTRDEYRLTRMTSYFRSNNLSSGDEVFLGRDDENRHYVWYERANDISGDDTGVLKLGSSWKLIQR